LTSDQISVISKSEAQDIITKHNELFGSLSEEQLQYHIFVQECILVSEYAKAKLLVDAKSTNLAQAQDSFIIHTPTPALATFGDGEEEVTFYGLMRTSPDDYGNEGDLVANDGTSQFYQIMMTGKRYAELKRVKVNVKQVFLSVGLDRRQGERSLALMMLRQALITDKDDRGKTFVVATDSIRIGSNQKLVSRAETMINNHNATLQFIETWGLVKKESVKTDDGKDKKEKGVLIAVKEREEGLKQVGRDYGTNKNPGASVKGDKVKQELVKKKQKKIRETMSTNTSITIAAKLGVLFMEHLGFKTEQRKNSEENRDSVLGTFIKKWQEIVKEGTDQAAGKFIEFYEKNKADVNIDAFLRDNGISKEELVASYARATHKRHGYPNSQITMNCAAECILYEGNMPDITICDLGKHRDTIGNPGFVALMILACSGRVKRVVMTTPVRASSELKELDVMKELKDTLKKNTDDFYIFSECIGKDHNALFLAEHNRRKAIRKAHETYHRRIAELVGELSESEKSLYNHIRSIYESYPTRFIEDVAYEDDEEEEVDEGEDDEESEGENNEEE